MPTRKLTASFVKAAEVEPGKTRTIYWDTELSRFGLMVTASGHKSYVLQYRDQLTRTQSRMSWQEDTFELKKARELAKDAKAAIRLGGNPLTDRRRAEGLKENTLQAVADEYLKRRAASFRSRDLIKSSFERLVYPRLGKIQIGDIKRSEIVRMLDQIEENNGPVAADRALAMLRAVMNWHASRSDDFRTPIVRGMARSNSSERARERVLNDDELRAVWNAAGASTDAFGPLLRFILLTACRLREGANMTHSEVTGTDWTIPASRYKTKTDTLLPLSSAAQEVLAALPRITGVDYVFSSGTRPVSGFSNRKAKFDKICGVTGWTIHDLRRTARTLLARAGVRDEIAEQCLGHIIKGVNKVYNRHAYSAEKLQAFEALAGQIERIINPQPNVVPMRSEIPA
jgi:integrase